MNNTAYDVIKTFIAIALCPMLFTSCGQNKKPKEVVLYESYCASCHIAPDIQDLPKELWETSVLPAMAARMGIRTKENHPYNRLTFQEQAAVIKSGVYPVNPIIDLDDWEKLQSYIIEMAPKSLPRDTIEKTSKPLTQFKQKSLELDSVPGSLITYLDFDDKETIRTGNIRGILSTYNLSVRKNTVIGQYGSPISDSHFSREEIYVTTMGEIRPTELATGYLFKNEGKEIRPILNGLHRPVHTLFSDLNENGTEEVVISEFGDLSGNLRLLVSMEGTGYTEKTLINQPGIIRVVTKDMNGDNKLDLVVLTSQGDEGITILYQQENLSFTADKAIRFSPVYGSSWFELVDYDGDGDDDIITVHGDNADDTYIQKPYHGMRIHLNDGDNNFEETYFYALNGATRILAKDFDQDNDLDFALLSTFPDYENYPEFSFVYLDNTDAKNYEFSVHTLKNPALGRWFLMDSGDIDGDGDEDILLSTLTYGFTTVPKELEKQWNASKTDILILENVLH